MSYTIDRSYKSPNYSSRDGTPIALIVLHATVGSARSALNWLCKPSSKVSTHYLIDKTGRIYQLVDEADQAWHAGKSRWPGVPIVDNSVNACSIGIELENNNSGSDPYPPKQLAALVWLTEDIRTRHPIPLPDIVRHLDVCIPQGRKTDPAGFPMAWYLAQLGDAVPERYTEYSTIIGAPLGTLTKAVERFPIHDSPSPLDYTAADVQNVILPAYYSQALAVGVDPLIALGQMRHETEDLQSFWSVRPQRNPAGIGVTGEHTTKPMPSTQGWIYNPRLNRYEFGVSFPDWVLYSIPAHLGRLLAYALPLGTGTPAQQALIAEALKWRALPDAARGSAPTIRQLGKAHNTSGYGWADPGTEYGQRIAAKANELIGV